MRLAIVWYRFLRSSRSRRSAFTSSATQHGGQESTLLGFLPTLLHHGMVVVGLPYSYAPQMTLDEIAGGSPYGAGTIAAPASAATISG